MSDQANGGDKKVRITQCIFSASPVSTKGAARLLPVFRYNRGVEGNS